MLGRFAPTILIAALGVALVEGQINLPLMGVGAGASCSICLVNQATHSVSGVSTNAVTITTPTNGNKLILCVDYTSSRSLTSITTTNVTWHTLLSNITSGGGTGLTKIATAYGDVNSSAGTSVSILFSAATTSSANVTEWSGLLSSPLDGTAASNNGSNSPASTGAYSTGTANDLVMVCLDQDTTTAPTGFPSGYTQLTSASGGGLGIWPSYFVPAPAGSQSASWTIGSVKWATGIQGFKP